MSYSTKWLKMDLQTFADPQGDPAPTDPAGNPGANNEPPATPPPADPNPTDPKGGNDPKDPPADPKNPKNQEKTLTQSEVNNLIAKEAKKAQAKVLKQLGVEDFTSAKEGLEKFKEWQESQKTEAQKQAERLEQLEKEHGTALEQNKVLQAKLSAVGAGVDAKFVDDVIVLANNYVTEDVTMDDAIAQVLEKYPHFKGEPEEPTPNDPPAPKFSTGQHQKKQETELDQWLNAFKQ